MFVLVKNEKLYYDLLQTHQQKEESAAGNIKTEGQEE